MKKVLSILLVLLLALPTFAQKGNSKGVIFEEGTLAQALQKAKNNKRGPNLVFVDCYTVWCGPCKMVAEKVFPLEHVGKYFNSNFVNIKIDMEKGEGVEIGKKYNVVAYPTFLILDSDGNEINRVVGGGDADYFMDKVKKAMDPENNPKKLKERYETTRWASDALKYLDLLKTLYSTEEAKNFVKELYSTMNVRDLFTLRMWQHISDALAADTTAETLELVIAKKEEASRYLTADLVTKDVVRSIKNLAMLYVSGKLEPSQESKVVSYVNLLPYLTTNDPTTRYFVEVVNFYKAKDLQSIGALLKIEAFSQMGRGDRYSAESIILRVKGLPADVEKQYRSAQLESLKRELSALEKMVNAM